MTYLCWSVTYQCSRAQCVGGGWMKCKIRLKLGQLGCSWQLGLLLGLCWAWQQPSPGSMNVQVIKILILISLKYHYPRNKQTHTTLVAMKAYMLGPVTSSRHVVLFTIFIIINLKFPLYICVKYGNHEHLIISHSSQILLNIFIPGVRKNIIKIIHSKPSQKRNGTVWNSILNVMTDFDIKIKCTFQPK